MRGWRISEWQGLNGAGGLFAAGRWHSKGHPVIYLGEHPALAMVEIMAHMRLSLTAIPTALKLIAVDILDGAAISPTPTLPSGWQANEPTSRAVGDKWLLSGAGLALPVPSAIIAHAINYIVNPTHAQAVTHLKESSIEPFWFDARMLR